MKPSLAIIGFGRFGKLMYTMMKNDYTIFVYDTKNGKSRLSLSKCLEADCIILAVPINKLKTLLVKLKKLLKNKRYKKDLANKLFIDVCSVKEYPIRLMKQYLPKKVQILGSHPMFGPDSYGLKDNKIVLCPVRIKKERLKQITSYLKKKKLKIIKTTSKQHDKEIARSLALVHYLGRALENIKAKPQQIDSEGYKRLLHILETVSHDTTELFYDMYHYNPYAKKERNNFLKALKNINKKLK